MKKMALLFLLFLLFHYEAYSGLPFFGGSSDEWMIKRANQLAKAGITHIYLYPTTYLEPARVIWAEDVARSKKEGKETP